MQKPKRQPKNFFQYFVDEFILFRRDFYFEVNVSSEIMVYTLNNLFDENNTGWWQHRRIIPKVRNLAGQFHFELLAEQPARSGYNQSAKAEGIIYSDEDLTILEGQIMMWSWGYFFFIILIAFFGLLSLISSNTPPLLAVVMVYGLFAFGFWIRSYFDRNYLLKLIQEAVESANESINDQAKTS